MHLFITVEGKAWNSASYLLNQGRRKATVKPQGKKKLTSQDEYDIAAQNCIHTDTCFMVHGNSEKCVKNKCQSCTLSDAIFPIVSSVTVTKHPL